VGNWHGEHAEGQKTACWQTAGWYKNKDFDRAAEFQYAADFEHAVTTPVRRYFGVLVLAS
jgi:hypothetical protein